MSIDIGRNKKNVKAHGKGKTHDKGLFAVHSSLPCAIFSLCRPHLFAVRLNFSLSSGFSLPCALIFLCRLDFFAVRRQVTLPCADFFAVRRLFDGRQRMLCRAKAHGKKMTHGSASFSRILSIVHVKCRHTVL